MYNKQDIINCKSLYLKEIAKREKFGRVFVAYRSDMKKTWQVISETLSRNIKKNRTSLKICS